MLASERCPSGRGVVPNVTGSKLSSRLMAMTANRLIASISCAVSVRQQRPIASIQAPIVFEGCSTKQRGHWKGHLEEKRGRGDLAAGGTDST